jgi:hypothetical protein
MKCIEKETRYIPPNLIGKSLPASRV